MRRTDGSGIVVALDASWCNWQDGLGDDISIGMRRGGFVRDNDMHSFGLGVWLWFSWLSLLIVLNCIMLCWVIL